MARDTIHLSDELEQRNDVLFQKLVPFQGKCETAEGEALRAVNKIVYRYYNDGDKFFRGYGCETAGPAHAYLMDESIFRDAIRPILQKMDGANDRSYERGLVALTDTVVTQIELLLRLGEKLTPNTQDMFDCDSHFQE
jgi:hypothetical protein